MQRPSVPAGKRQTGPPRCCTVLHEMCESSNVRRTTPLGSVAIFYLLAFSLSWLIGIPQAAAARGISGLQLAAALGFVSALAPTLAAIVMSLREGGAPELRHL